MKEVSSNEGIFPLFEYSPTNNEQRKDEPIHLSEFFLRVMDGNGAWQRRHCAPGQPQVSLINK